MEVAFILIPLAVMLVFVILAGLWWAIQSGQFEDLEEEGARILEQD
ncbi:MAG TPA: cbb3-type cytochrome oxidase assembly protein CcoS [Methylophilus sp.]